MMAELELSVPEKAIGLLPIVSPIVGAILLIVVRIQVGRPVGFIYCDALIMLALISYICAAVLLVTNIFVKEKLLDRLSLFTVAIGYCFNMSGWMIRWVEAGDKEGWKEGINGVWRYFPLDNLYALTLGFCAGAALATLVVIRKPQYRALGALSMPILVVILALGMMLGSGINTLPPILDSYWRPIHVSIATLAYGVCLFSFGLAFAYLLRDGIRSEAVAIWAGLYGLLSLGALGFGTAEAWSVPLHAEYTVTLFMDKKSLPVRAELPTVGPLMALTLLVLIVSVALFGVDHFNKPGTLRKWAWRSFNSAVVLQAAVLIVLFFQMKSLGAPASLIPSREYPAFSVWMSEQSQQAVTPEQARMWVKQNASSLKLSMTSNPVEFGGLIGLFVALFLVALFSWKRHEVVSALPSLKTIDSLLYRTVGVAFPLLSLLLITGAGWANE